MSLVTPDMKESNFRSSYSNNMSIGEVVLKKTQLILAVMVFPGRILGDFLVASVAASSVCVRERSAMMQLFQRSCPVFLPFNAIVE